MSPPAWLCLTGSFIGSAFVAGYRRFSVSGGWVLAAVGWFLWWCGRDCCGDLSCGFLCFESCECFLVFRHCGNRGTPGWDEANPGIKAVHVAAPGRPLRVIVVDAVVVGAQESQVFNVGVATCLPRDEMVYLAVIGWFIAAGS